MGYKVCQYCDEIFTEENGKYVKISPKGEFDVHLDIWYCPEHEQKRYEERKDAENEDKDIYISKTGITSTKFRVHAKLRDLK